MLAFTSELRATVWGNLGGVLFIDGGNVWARDWSIDLNDLRYAVGVGPALPDAGRPDPSRLGLPAQPD